MDNIDSLGDSKGVINNYPKIFIEECKKIGSKVSTEKTMCMVR